VTTGGNRRVSLTETSLRFQNTNKQMASFVETATQFFDDLEMGRGRDVVGKFLADGAVFHCDCLPQKTLLE